MKTAFLTEGGWFGKIPRNHLDMRNDSAWMHIFDATHFPIIKYNDVKDFDNVFIMFPKGHLSLNMYGSKVSNTPNYVSPLLASDMMHQLKKNNKKVYYIQEGPTYLFNDYDIVDQFNFYNMLAEVDTIYAHNLSDIKFYKGLFPNKNIDTIPPVMIEDSLNSIQKNTEDKVIIGGNFANWYGGFQSYIVSDVFGVPKFIQESHAKREQEDMISDLTHIPRQNWFGWMNSLSSFKYAVHLMPTPAAGTFSMNCAYFGIPCIGNIKVDTQNICHPELSVDVYDVESALNLAIRLRDDKEFYTNCSITARQNYEKYYKEEVFRNKFQSIM
jgi:hypothetical protein